MCVRASVTSHSLQPCDCSLPGSSVLGVLQAKILKWVAMPSSGDLPDPEIKPMAPGLLHCRQILFPLSHLKSPSVNIYIYILFHYGLSQDIQYNSYVIQWDLVVYPNLILRTTMWGR